MDRTQQLSALGQILWLDNIEEHLRVLLGEAQRLVDRALGDAKA